MPQALGDGETRDALAGPWSAGQMSGEQSGFQGARPVDAAAHGEGSLMHRPLKRHPKEPGIAQGKGRCPYTPPHHETFPHGPGHST